MFEDDKWLFVKPVEERQKEEGNEYKVGEDIDKGEIMFFLFSPEEQCAASDLKC